MSVLLAAIPSALAAFVFLLAYSDIRKCSVDDPPSKWQWKLVGPALVGSATPLTLAARQAHAQEQVLILLAPALGAVFLVVGVFAGLNEGDFNRIFDRLRLGSRRIGDWRIHHVIALSTMVLMVGATASVLWVTFRSTS